LNQLATHLIGLNFKVIFTDWWLPPHHVPRLL